MKNYGVKQTWAVVPYDDEDNDYITRKKSSLDDVNILLSTRTTWTTPHGELWIYLETTASIKKYESPVFVESLVSPRVNERQKRNGRRKRKRDVWEVMNFNKFCKVGGL